MRKRLEEEEDEREHCIMDNFRIEVVSMVKAHFEAAIAMAFDCHQKASHYKIDKNHGFIFYWAEDEADKAIALPYEMDAKQAAAFAWGWLQKQEYPPEPDHDGDNEKGFRVYNEEWGHVGHSHYAFVAIQPEWAMQGK